MRPFRPMVQKHKLKGDFNLLIDSTHIFLLVSRKPLLILILTSTFLAQNVTIIGKKKKLKKLMALIQTPRVVIVAWNDFLLPYLCMPCPVTRHVHSSWTKSLSAICSPHSEAGVKHCVLRRCPRCAPGTESL